MNRISKQMRKNTRNGFTLTEMLCTVLLIALISTGLVTGVDLGARQFTRSMRLSESQQLYSTLQTILTNELKFTNEITLLDDGRTVNTFYSVTYALESSPTSLYVLDADTGTPVRSDSYGQLAIGSSTVGIYNRLLGKMSYTKDLGAKASITYNSSENYFTVNLSIGVNGDSNPYINESFDVRPLNNVVVEVSQ